MKFVSVLTWIVFLSIILIGCMPSPKTINRYLITSYDGGKVISIHVVDWFQFRDNGNIYFSDKDGKTYYISGKYEIEQTVLIEKE
jgi:hypothetical protein